MKEIFVNRPTLLAILIPVLFLSGCNVIDIGFDNFFDPEDITIDFKEGKEIDLQFEVVASCFHEVGIGFRNALPKSKEDKNIMMEDFFGNVSTLNLPAEIDVTVVDKKNKTILEKSLGGKAHGWTYGPNPVRFIAESVYLPAGAYQVKIKVNRCYKDFQEVEAFFFANQPSKTFCAKQ